MKVMLLHVPGVGVFFSEDIEEVANGYRLIAKESLLLVPQNTKDGLNFNAIKTTELNMKPTELFIPLHAVQLAQDCVDEVFLNNMRSALAGIILAKSIPPELRGPRR